MSSAVDYSKERILIIDDMPAARSSVAYLARMAGATQVDTAASYQDAIARIRSGPKPGIVLCDYHLGEGRTGQHLLDELVHTNLIGPETVFIMITAEGAPGHVVAAAELAPDDYLLKPLKAALLAERLQKQVIRKRTLAKIVRLQKEGIYILNYLRTFSAITLKSGFSGLGPFRVCRSVHCNGRRTRQPLSADHLA